MSNGEEVKPPRKPYWDRPENRRQSDTPISDPDPRDIEKVREEISRSKRVKSAYNPARFKASIPQMPPRTAHVETLTTEPGQEFRRSGPGWDERERALTNLEFEKRKRRDRLSKARAERIQRMRSPNERRGEKRLTPEALHNSLEANVDLSERARRINILLRAGVYDRKDVSTLPDMVKVTRRDTSPDEAGKVINNEIFVPKKDIEEWFNSLTSYEKKRLYVLGRKKIDFKFNEAEFLKDYFKRNAEHQILGSDSDEKKMRKQERIDSAVADAKTFQREQKELADALEFVAIPMLEAVFKSLGKKVEIYLTSANDDIAGGLDIAVELKKRDGSPHRFHGNGMPMRFVIDMTYARMKGKLQKDLDRGRISQDAFDILKGENRNVPSPLSNARAMKLFRSMVETIGGNMSIMTFGKRGPLPKPQEHVPRLILGLDWESAFSEIANWVEEGDSFGENFKDTPMARRITRSIESQLKGLHAMASRSKDNPNTDYLAQILRTMDFTIDPAKGIADDRSLENIDNLLSADDAALDASLRKRLYEAALAQVEHDKKRGERVRGDMKADLKSASQEVIIPIKAEPSSTTAAIGSEETVQSLSPKDRMKKIEEIEVEIAQLKLKIKIRAIEDEIARLKAR